MTNKKANETGSSRGVNCYLLNDPQKQNTPLHVLAGAAIDQSMRASFLAAVQILVNDPTTKINAVNTDGSTPLMYACMGCNEDIALLLIDLKADVTVKNQENYSVLHYALHEKLNPVVEVLKERYPEAVVDCWVEGTL